MVQNIKINTFEVVERTTGKVVHTQNYSVWIGPGPADPQLWLDERSAGAYRQDLLDAFKAARRGLGEDDDLYLEP